MTDKLPQTPVFVDQVMTRDELWRMLEEHMRHAWTDPVRLYPLVRRAIDHRFAREALPYAEQLFRRANGMEIGALILAETQRKAGLLAEARATLTGQQARTGPSALLLLNRAKVEGNLGQGDVELALLRQSLEIDPNTDQAVELWQAIHRDRFGHDAAIGALEDVARLPGTWRPQMWLARRVHERGDTERAVALFRHAVTASRFDKDCVTMAVGTLSPELGIAALADYEPRTGPPHVGFLLVELLAKTGRSKEATSTLRTVESQAVAGPIDPAARHAILSHTRHLRTTYHLE